MLVIILFNYNSSSCKASDSHCNTSFAKERNQDKCYPRAKTSTRWRIKDKIMKKKKKKSKKNILMSFIPCFSFVLLILFVSLSSLGSLSYFFLLSPLSFCLSTPQPLFNSLFRQFCFSLLFLFFMILTFFSFLLSLSFPFYHSPSFQFIFFLSFSPLPFPLSLLSYCSPLPPSETLQRPTLHATFALNKCRWVGVRWGVRGIRNPPTTALGRVLGVGGGYKIHRREK